VLVEGVFVGKPGAKKGNRDRGESKVKFSGNRALSIQHSIYTIQNNVATE
jgi:hypothetical protein